MCRNRIAILEQTQIVGGIGVALATVTGRFGQISAFPSNEGLFLVNSSQMVMSSARMAGQEEDVKLAFWSAAVAAALIGPASASTVFNFDLSSGDAEVFESQYTDYDGVNPSSTPWSVTGFIEIDSDDSIVKTGDDPSEVVSWGFSFTDGSELFSLGSGDAFTTFILDAIVDNGTLVIQRLTARYREFLDEDLQTYEVVSVEDKGSYYLTEVDAALFKPNPDGFQSRGFRGRALTQTQPIAEIAPIPLPAAGWVLIAGFGGLAAVTRRRRAS